MATRDSDPTHLHPLMRERVAAVLKACADEGLPLRLFEGWRSPHRQAALYAQGRTAPGKVVTYARAWESYHQYGLAVDLVGHVDGSWTWDLPKAVWRRMHEIGRAHGLEPLGFETPHLQVADLRIGNLMEGAWPDGGDASWYDTISAAIASWGGTPPAPPLPRLASGRPPLLEETPVAALDWSQTPVVGLKDWHGSFGGQEWRYDAAGVYLRASGSAPQRSPGAPITVQAILALHGPEIHAASLRHGIPPELIVMTIATETAFARKADFTGPATFRWEPHVKVTDVDPPSFGDYSAGPMQTLATTARDVIRRMRLDYKPFDAAPYIAERPARPPESHPLYEAALNIDIGTAEIRSRLRLTGFDPIHVAAAYNAGGLYESGQNAWHLRCANDHLDRAARWFGDACFVLAPLRLGA